MHTGCFKLSQDLAGKEKDKICACAYYPRDKDEPIFPNEDETPVKVIPVKKPAVKKGVWGRECIEIGVKNR